MKYSRNSAVIILSSRFFLVPISLSIMQFSTLQSFGRIMYFLILFIGLPVAGIYYLIAWFSLNQGEHYIIWVYTSEYGWVLILSQIIFKEVKENLRVIYH